MASKTAYRKFCAKFNREGVTICAGCGLPLREEPAKQSEELTKRPGFRFLLSRIGAVDFMHLHLH